MHISVTHSTVYRYDQPVRLGLHVIRLRPRDDGAQRLLSQDLRIDPPPSLRSQGTDAEGNVVTHAWFDRAASSLEIHSRFHVETLRENPFDFLLSGEACLPLAYPEPLRAILAPYLEGEAEAGAVRDFARSTSGAAHGTALDFLMELTGRMHREFRQVSRLEGPPCAAPETLAAGAGACRDLAVLFAAACRSVGLAARFVSGYEREAARDPSGAAMHAWAEVYLPGGGWRGFDPSQGLAVATSHVAVAASRIPEMAAPLTGAYRGPGSSTLETSVRMEVGE